jgi:cell division control protein 7
MLNIKNYMMGLIKSIQNIHSIGIIHRDIKPDNFLYNFETNEYMLIDFGLAEVILFYQVRKC